MNKPLLILVILAGVLLCFIAGFYTGRATLERAWSNPVTQITPAQHQAAAVAEADPTPEVGTKILNALPLARMRQELEKRTSDDRLRVTLTSWGSSDEGSELHLMLRNDTPCKVTSYSGVAYAYNAVGRPVKANKGGEPYVTFTSAAVEGGVSIEKGAKYIHSQGMKYPQGASLGAAHVDAYQCEDGTKWARASL